MLQRMLSWLAMVFGTVTGFGNSSAPSPTPAIPLTEIEIDAGTFEYRFFRVESDEELNLIYNYDNRIDAAKLIATHGCGKAINGGFYDENSKPLGLVISNSRQLADDRPNRLFNGYVFSRESGTGGISERPVYANVKDVLQTGPLLIVDGKERAMTSTLSPARRMVALQLRNGTLIFMTVFVKDSKLDGPALSDLAKAVVEISEVERWDTLHAINLDGGSASVFFENGELVKEWQPVGSLWCVSAKNL